MRCCLPLPLRFAKHNVKQVIPKVQTIRASNGKGSYMPRVSRLTASSMTSMMSLISKSFKSSMLASSDV